MATYVAFLRAINLGAKRTFPKADLQRVVEETGACDVAVHLNPRLLQSGDHCPLVLVGQRGGGLEIDGVDLGGHRGVGGDDVGIRRDG